MMNNPRLVTVHEYNGIWILPTHWDETCYLIYGAGCGCWTDTNEGDGYTLEEAVWMVACMACMMASYERDDWRGPNDPK